jgi:hypothetical protein
METYEKLGAFFLGRPVDASGDEPSEGYLLYDSKDLTTHAVCVGMTGSGKTGLCIALLEEAALDGVPALAIDPKGDLGNLLLTFPNLDGASFEPWVDPADAHQKGVSVEELAESQAELWRNGLRKWGQSGERLARLRDTADFLIYTPGSEAGIPISVLSSFAAPPPAVIEDGDLYHDRIGTTVTSLLTLLGVDADPIQSPEHILLSTLLDHHWRRGQDLDLGALIQAIQNPPVEKIGVLDLESFYPGKERFKLAMRINSLLAAPGFQGWLTGQPLAIDQLLYTPEGKPRIAIVSIAHLEESERMFFVSLLLNEVLSWIRTRPGTDSLRAILYMDEIFGYMPPIGEPPSKKPLVTLLKQARAYGLGVVLATQNPVDLDYKGLSNTGTWFLGRLQTERDKLRVLDGLEGAAAGAGGFDRRKTEQTLAGLGKRVFLLHNVHDTEPVLFHTRWAMSYLRGPLTRNQIRTLMEPHRSSAIRPETGASQPSTVAASPAVADDEPDTDRPVVPPEVPQAFVPVQRYTNDLRYRAVALGAATVHFTNRQRTVQTDEQVVLAAEVTESATGIDWSSATELGIGSHDLGQDPEAGALFEPLSTGAVDQTRLREWNRSFADNLYRTRTCELLRSPSTGLQSEPGESERDFRIRIGEAAREVRDRATEELRERYATRLTRLEERISRARERVEREKSQVTNQTLQSAVSVGAAVLSAFLGRKKLSSTTLSKAGTAAKGMSRAGKEARDVTQAKEAVEKLEEELRRMELELESEIDELAEKLDPLREALETLTLRPRRTDVRVELVGLGWLPYEGPASSGAPLFRLAGDEGRT